MSQREFVLLSDRGTPSKPYIVMGGPKRFAVVIRRKWGKQTQAYVAGVEDSIGRARMLMSDMVANGYPRRLIKVYPVTDLTIYSKTKRYV